MIFGLDLFTFGVAFILFAIILVFLWNIVWHTFHGEIGQVFIIAIIGVVLASLIFLVSSCFIS